MLICGLLFYVKGISENRNTGRYSAVREVFRGVLKTIPQRQLCKRIEVNFHDAD